MTKRTFTIQLPTDSNGLVGRQCTKSDCNKYFQVKPGTGLSKPTQAFCPYCGHADDPSDFLTEEQKEYMLSVVGNQDGRGGPAVEEARIQHSRARRVWVGISLKISHTPEPIRNVVERAIETPLTCDRCTLAYSIYGIFTPHARRALTA